MVVALGIATNETNNPVFPSDSNLASVIEGAPMSRSSFASFHLTGIKPSSGKLMTSSVDRLFENDSEVFISSNYNEFNQVSNGTIIMNHDHHEFS